MSFGATSLLQSLNKPLRYTDPDGQKTNEVNARLVAQGVSTSTGQALPQDSHVRSQYSPATQELKPTGGDAAARTDVQEAAPDLSSPAVKIAICIRYFDQATAGKAAAQLAESVGRINPTVNAVMENACAAGPLLLGLGATASAVTIANATAGERGTVAAEDAGAFGGAIAGGNAGAKAGAVISSFFCPGPGTAIGAVVGTDIGGDGCAIVTSRVAERL